MLETALLASHSPARAHAVRVSLPAIVALHGAVLAGFIVASAWHDGEPPEPVEPITFATFASPPPPRGDGGPSPAGPQPVHASMPHASQLPRVDRIPDEPAAASSETADAATSTEPSGGDEAPGSGGGGSRFGVDGGTGTVDAPIGDEPRGEPLVPGGAVSYPALVHRVEPEYPDAARRAHIQGVVILDAVITSAGDVEEVRVLKSVNPLLDDAAARAVRQWTYRPATLDGRAVRVRLTVTVTFSIPGG